MNIKRIHALIAMIGMGILTGPAPGPAARAGSITFEVTADTSSVATSTGNLEFQFIPGNTTPLPPLATAVVSSFSSDGFLIVDPTIPSPYTSGDVSGTLPGTTTLTNDDPSGFNDYFQGFTYGTTVSFDVTLYGPAVGSATPGNPYGTTFSFFLEDSSGNGLASGGSSLDLNINYDGSVTVSNNSLTNGGPPVTVTLVTQSVPEPASAVLLGLGLVGIVELGRRQGRRDRVAT